MSASLWIVGGLLVLGCALYQRLDRRIGTAALLLYLILWVITSTPALAAVIVISALFLVTAAALNLTSLRRRRISDPLFARFRKLLPPLSQTEREAMEAGTVGWEAEIFSGAPRWQRLLEPPKPELTAAEQAFLDGPTETLCRMLDDWRIHHEDYDLPEPVWQFIKSQGFFGLIIPKRFGGFEFSPLAHSAVVTRIASRSVPAAVTVMVPNSLGPAELLLEYGTSEQQQYYLPRLAKGQEIPCFALTSSVAGSDAGSLTDAGVVCRQTFQGKPDCLGIRLNWDKRYITLAPVATLLGLAFKLYDPDHLLGETEELGITLALIPTDLPGITIGRRHLPAGVPFQNGPTQGKDVFIPIDWIIGGRERAGQGWRMLMEALAAGRGISLPALGTGAAQLAGRLSGAYARVREQFGLPIGRFEGIAEPLARIAGAGYQMEAARLLIISALMQGEKPAVLSAIAKYQLTEGLRRVVNDAMDIHGGKAICLGPANLLSHAYLAIPIAITVEGANILTRSMIIFGQGAIRCHPYIRRELDAAAMPDREAGARSFDQALFGHLGFILSNALRALLLGLTAGRLSPVPDAGPLRRYYQRITRLSAAFAIATDLALLSLGSSLKRREALSGRFADCLGQLCMATAVLRHYHLRGEPIDEWPLLRWACEDSLQRSEAALAEICRNFPVRPVGWLLRLCLFPLGRRQAGPDDALMREAADTLLQPGALRKSLTDGIYIPTAEDEPLVRLETAFARVIATESAANKVHAAVRARTIVDGPGVINQALAAGIIDFEEATALESAEAARREALAVDDFAADKFAPRARRSAPDVTTPDHIATNDRRQTPTERMGRPA